MRDLHERKKNCTAANQTTFPEIGNFNGHVLDEGYYPCNSLIDPLWLQANPLVATLHWQIHHNIIVVPANLEYKFVSS
jgi:hypothetical protein